MYNVAVMKKIMLAVVVASLCVAGVAFADEPFEGPWKGKGLECAPAEHRAPEMDTNGVTAAFFDSVPWKGRPTRFFAYYALPKGASREKPVPGVVLVHGGGGTAFEKFVRYWNDRGYAAISMDNCGSIPRNEPGKPGGGEFSRHWRGHAWSGPRGWETFADGDLPPGDQWPYHAVATVLLSHSFLRSLPGVDPSRIGVSGVSWGGFLTAIAGAVDHRFRWANPVYGCGFLGVHSVWEGKIAAAGEAGRNYLRLWDPSVYLPLARCPYLWVSGQHDFAYPVDSLLRSAALVPRSYFDVPDELPHGHTPGFVRPSIVSFAQAMNKGAAFSAGYPEPYDELEREVADEYSRPVRPIGVNGQPAWNGHSLWFMYPPTFGFTNLPQAARYRFTVRDTGRGGVWTFEAPTATASLKSVWRKVPVGWVKVTCEAVDAEGRTLAQVGERTFWRQMPYRPGAYRPADRPYAETAKAIARYVMNIEIVRALYTSGRPVPKEMVTRANETFIAYPSKMGAALLKEMAALAKSDPSVRDDALRMAAGVCENLRRITEPDGAPLAGFPRTYQAHPGLTEHPAEMVRKNGGKIMLIYPEEVASAYIALYEAVHDESALTAAKRIADRYVALQGADGTWPLNCWIEDGRSVEANRLVPVQVMAFLDRIATLTGEPRYRRASDAALAYIEKGLLKTWNWEGQFEDVKPTAPYVNLTKHNACDLAIHLVRRFPKDARRLAQARELLRFSEDQFVCWECPFLGYTDTFEEVLRHGVWGLRSWRCPGVLEQYKCYVPIDASAAKLIEAYLALYRAEGRPLDLAKARTLGDAIVRETSKDGYCPTFWFDFREDWPNCMLASALALEHLARAESGSGDEM